jgi:hypothetical protein
VHIHGEREKENSKEKIYLDGKIVFIFCIEKPLIYIFKKENITGYEGNFVFFCGID